MAAECLIEAGGNLSDPPIDFLKMPMLHLRQIWSCIHTGKRGRDVPSSLPTQCTYLCYRMSAKISIVERESLELFCPDSSHTS